MRRLLMTALLLVSSFVYSAVPALGQGAALPIADITVTGTPTLVRSDAPPAYTDVSCTNHHATVHVRWGDASVTATKGQRIAAGATVEIPARPPLYMISEGVDVTVSCTVTLK